MGERRCWPPPSLNWWSAAALWPPMESAVSERPPPPGADCPMPAYRDHTGCCCYSVAKSCPTLCSWTAAGQASPSFTIPESLLRFMSLESVMPSNHLILCCLLLILPSILPNIRVFSNESALVIIITNIEMTKRLFTF